MKVVYAEEALRNLGDISDYIRQNYPTIPEAFHLRLQFVVAAEALRAKAGFAARELRLGMPSCDHHRERRSRSQPKYRKQPHAK